MKFVAPVAFVTLAVAAVACSKTPPAPPPRVPMPAEVVAIIQMPSADGAISAFIDYAARVDPATADEVRDGLADADAKNFREGFDWARPGYIIFVAPPPGAEDPEVAVVGAVRDAAALEKMKVEEGTDFDVRIEKSWAIVGDAGAVTKAEAWALRSLATAPPPTKISATLFAPAFRKRWAAELRAELDPGDSAGAAFLRDAVMGLVEQTERIDATAEISNGVIAVDIAITPRTKTSLASMLAAQKPASFTLLEKLPLDQPFGTMAAHLTLGPYGAPIRSLIMSTLTSALGPFGPRSATLFETLWSLGSGEYAGVTIGASGMVVNAISVSDPAKAYAEIDELATAVSTVAISNGLRFEIAHPTHDGVELGLGRLDAGDASFAAGWAAWDKILALSMSDPDGAVLRSTIDRSRGKPNAIPAMAKVIADARARGDSFLLTFDVLEDKRAPLVVTFGVRDGVGHLWTSVPAAQVTAMLAMPAFN